MFSAFDKNKKKIVSASSVKTKDGNYECSTQGCLATMLIRSIDGKNPPHFYKHKNSKYDHNFNCKCIQKYGKNKRFKDCKIDINNIFNASQNTAVPSDTSSKGVKKSNRKKDDTIIDTISTPKTLLAFGISHDLSEMINSTQTLHEIFIDDRNCFEYSHNVNGIKMIVCNTLKYNTQERFIDCLLTSKDHSYFSMNIKIIFPEELNETFNKLINYVFNNSADKRFSKFPLAILGDWNTIETNSNSISITTTLKSSSHIIYTHI